MGAATTAATETLQELFTDARAQATKTKRNETTRTQKDDDDDNHDSGDDAATAPPLDTPIHTIRAARAPRLDTVCVHVREHRQRQAKRIKSIDEKSLQKATWRCVHAYVYISVCVCVCVYI